MNQEVLALKQEVLHLKEALALLSPGGQSELAIRLHVERSPEGRKPFLLTFQSPAQKAIRLSSNRTAIMLALLFDYAQRSSGGAGLHDTKHTAIEVFRRIGSVEDPKSANLESVRVAWYRFKTLWQEEFAGMFSASLDLETGRLQHSGEPKRFSIEISSNDPCIQEALPALGASSMLEQLKYSRFLFVPAGGNGGEMFLKEIYEAPGHVQNTSAYVRPQMITLPPRLLEKRITSKTAAERYHLMHKRLSCGTLSYHEFVPEDSLPAALDGDSLETLEDKFDHLAFIEQLIRADCGYKLILTRAEIPFYVATYDSKNLNFTTFFRLPSETASDYASFAVWGDEIKANVKQSIFSYLLSHPTTQSESRLVLHKINGCRTALIEKRASLLG